jgi:vacuolar protein sorting-associated protein 13A/C
LKLPLDIIDGHLGQLVLQIPWSNLKNQPVKILIEDVFLVAASKFNTFNDIDPDDEDRRAHILKLNKLAKYEVTSKFQAESNLSPEEARKQQSFTESLVNKIVDNLQITIRNIHVRFEDRSTGIPLSIGLSLEEFSALSTDSNWNPSFIEESTGITRKLATLKSLSMYWNTDSESVRESDDLLHFMATAPSTTVKEFQYILRPVSGVGHIILNKDPSEPATNAQLVFENLGFVFDNEQYRDIILVAEEFRKYQQIMQYVRLRPKVPVEKDPKAWFKYAGDVILKQVRDNRKQWTWNYILERRQDRLRYIELYKKRETAVPGSIPDAESEEFDLIEKKYPFSDLKFFRSLAKSELKREKKNQPPPEPQSWSSWIWGSSTATKEIAGEVVTEEQENEFYDAIEWDENQATEALDDKSDSVVLKVSTMLKTGSFTLRNDPHGNRSYDVMNVLFNGFKLDFGLRGGGNSFLADLSLQELRVDDGSPDTLFKQVVTVKSLRNDVLHISHDDCHDHSINLEPTFFGLTYEHNPLEGTADSNLFLKMQGIIVFYNKLVVENVVRFFKPPKSHLQTVGALLNAAGATVEEFRDLTRMGLEYALQKHKTLNLKLDIQAPLIVIPSDVTDVDSSCAIFDAGHISVESHLASKEIVEKVQKKQSEPYNEEDWKTLESLMYDRYNVKLHSTQFMVGSSLRNTMNHINTGFENSNTIVIDKVNVDFLVEVSILPEAHNITRFKTSGNLPLLLASISDEKYRILMLIIESSIPNFDLGVGTDDEETINAFTGISTEAPALTLLDESDDDSSTVVSQKQSANDRQLLEFDFGIDKVSLSLNRCVSKSTLEQDLLIDLSLHSFKFDLKVRDDNIVAHTSLLNISIEDYIQKLPSGELTKVVSSSDVNDKVDKKLLTFAYNRDNLSGDQNIDLDLLTVKFVLTPKTILSLMDFARSTFNPSPDVTRTATPDPVDQEITKSISDVSPTSPASSLSAAGKLNLKIQLRSIIVVLNDDGIKVATFQLDQAQADVELISEDINVHARIGQLSLHDDINEGVSRNSLLRTLVSMEDKDLAELRYKTFNHPSKPMDYSSMVFFRAGSIRVNLVQEPLTRLSTFLSRFSQMKKFYDAARDAAMNQAKQIDGANNIQFDVLISSPIVVIPRLTGPTDCDLLVVHLGDIFARNEFTNSVENNIVTGIRSIKLSSEIGNVPLDVLGNVDLAFNAVYNTDTSVTVVKGFLSDANIKLTELQLEFLLEASAALSSIASGDSGLQASEIDELGQELGIKGNLESLGLVGNNPLSDERLDKDSNKLSLEFDVRNISVSLYANTKSIKPDGEDLEKFALSKFSLNKTKFSLQIKGNGDINTDFAIKSFTVEDTRQNKDNRFTEIIPAASKSVSNQFIAVASLKEGSNGNKLLKADLTVTNPRIILAIDYLVALKFFSDAAIPSTKPIADKLGLEPIVEEEEFGFAPESALHTSTTPLASENPSTESKIEIEYNVKITDSSVILLSDPKLVDTEAIVFKVDLISLIQKDDVIKTNVNDVGMFLCRMNRFYDNRLRIIDDFSVCAVLDMSSGIISKVDVSCQALVLRLSLRDVLLALDIFKRASEMASPGTEPSSTLASAKKELSDNSQVKSLDMDSGHAPTTLSRRRSSINFSGRRPSLIQSTSIAPVRKFVEQRLRVEFEGLRFVMIGTVHELPMLDGCVRPFTVTANNWSEMSNEFFASATMDTFWNIYNHEKSAWEPLLEPWNVTFEASKPKADQIAIDVKSDKKAEATITALTISTLNKALSYFSEDIDFLNKTREKATLYRIENQTGFDFEVWATQDSTTDSTNNKMVVRDGEEIPWNFDDWHTMRENLSVDSQKVELNIKLNGIPFDTLSNVSVASIGEQLYDLKHSRGGPNGQLVCEVVLTDTVKRVILRSPLTFKNQTQVAIEMCLDSSSNTSRRWKIEPGQSQSVPINHHSREAVSFRPDSNYGFNWNDNPVHWQNLLSRPKSYSCTASANSDIKFFIQFTITNKNITPAAASGNTYPTSLHVVLTPPVEVTNLLPFDMTYRIYDKRTGKDWKNTLKKGATSAVHVVEPSRLLLLSVHPAPESGYDRSDFAVINAPLGSSDFSREYHMLLRSPSDGQKLKLNIHYLEDDSIKGNFCKIQIYTPYLILNKTGLDLHLQSKFSKATSKVQHSGYKNFNFFFFFFFFFFFVPISLLTLIF